MYRIYLNNKENFFQAIIKSVFILIARTNIKFAKIKTSFWAFSKLEIIVSIIVNFVKIVIYNFN